LFSLDSIGFRACKRTCPMIWFRGIGCSPTAEGCASLGRVAVRRSGAAA